MPGSIERKRGHRPPGIMKSSKVRTMTFCQIARLFPIPRSPITLDINSFFTAITFLSPPIPSFSTGTKTCASRVYASIHTYDYIYIYVIQALIVTSCASRYQIRSPPRFKAPQGSVSTAVSSMILFPPIRSDGGRFPETGTYRSRSRKEEGGGVAQKECGGCFWGRVIKYRGVAEDTWLTGASPLIIIRRERYNSRFAFRRKFDRISRPSSLSLFLPLSNVCSRIPARAKTRFSLCPPVLVSFDVKRWIF